MEIALDLETKGGGSFGRLEKVWGIAYGYANNGRDVNSFLPLHHLEPSEIRASVAGKMVQNWLYETPIFHNAAFDVAILRELGFDVPFFHDTMVLGYLANPNIQPIVRPGHKPERYSLWAWGIRLGEEKSEQPTFDEWTPELEPYAIQDIVVTRKLWDYLKNIFKRDPVAWQHYMEIERPYIEVIMEMNDVGLPVDIEGTVDVATYLEKDTERILNEMRAIVPLAPSGSKSWATRRHPEWESDTPVAGKRFYLGEKDGKHGYAKYVDFEPTPGMIAWALKRRGWQPEEFTAKGDPKTSRDVLEDVDDELAELKLEYAERQKLLSTYALTFLRRRGADGFVRCSWNQTITKTGRLSSSKPNLQNIPVRTELGRKFRGVIRAPEGYKLVGIDLQAIEYRVLAALQYAYFLETTGKVPDDVMTLIKVFNADPDTEEGDIHTQMAILWRLQEFMGVDLKTARNIGKNISYGRMFGFGKNRAAKMMRTTPEMAGKLIQQANEMNPSFAIFRNAVLDEFREKGIGHTLFGRRLVYPEMTLQRSYKTQRLFNGRIVVPGNEVRVRLARAERQAFNAKIQGTAADVLKILANTALPVAWQLGARMCANVHDEALFLPPTDLAEPLKEDLDILFRRDDLLPGVPVVGTAKIGDTWEETH